MTMVAVLTCSCAWVGVVQLCLRGGASLTRTFLPCTVYICASVCLSTCLPDYLDYLACLPILPTYIILHLPGCHHRFCRQHRRSLHPCTTVWWACRVHRAAVLRRITPARPAFCVHTPLLRAGCGRLCPRYRILEKAVRCGAGHCRRGLLRRDAECLAQAPAPIVSHLRVGIVSACAWVCGHVGGSFPTQTLVSYIGASSSYELHVVNTTRLQLLLWRCSSVPRLGLPLIWL